MPIFDKKSSRSRFVPPSSETPTDNVIKGEYDVKLDDEEGNHILKIYDVKLKKEQLIDEHSHNVDILSMVTDGIIEINENNKKSYYNKGDWFITKKGTKYSIKALTDVTMSSGHFFSSWYIHIGG